MEKEVKLLIGISITTIIILIIMGILESKSYAWSVEEFTEFLQETQGQTQAVPADYGSYFISHKQEFINAVETAGYDLDDYDSYFVRYLSGSSHNTWDTAIYVMASPSYSTNTYDVSKPSGAYLLVNHRKNGNWEVNNFSGSLSNFSRWYLATPDPTNNTFGQCVCQNYYNYVVGHSKNDWNIADLPWYIADGRIGKIYENENLTFNLHEDNIGITKRLLINNGTTLASGQTCYLDLTDVAQLQESEEYYITINDNEMTKTYATSNLFTIAWVGNSNNPAGTITNASGDITGTIDLTPIENKLDGINQAIQEMESGNQERQSFWENAYNTMFVPSENYIENKFEELIDEMSISDGESQEIIAFLQEIENSSGDFIIAWEDYTPHFSVGGQQIENVKMIEKNEINFSKMERENETFHDVMTWTRTLIGFGLSVLVIRQAWNLLLKTLGISTDIYEDTTDEKQIVQTTKGNKNKKKGG